LLTSILKNLTKSFFPSFVSKYFTRSNNLTLVAYHVRLGKWYLTFSNSKSNILDELLGIVQKYQYLTLFFFLI